MKYERSITSGLEVMAKVKVFVHAAADADGRATTLAPRTYMSQLSKNEQKCATPIQQIIVARREWSSGVACQPTPPPLVDRLIIIGNLFEKSYTTSPLKSVWEAVLYL